MPTDYRKLFISTAGRSSGPWEDFIMDCIDSDSKSTFRQHEWMREKEKLPMKTTNPILIKKVIFNDPATIVIWQDGTKTVVKTDGRDLYDPEKGLAMAIAKKALGNQGNYYNTFKTWLPETKLSKVPFWKTSLNTMEKKHD